MMACTKVFLLVYCAVFLVQAAPQRPHIVFMLIDDLGWNDVSMHGSSQIPTPTLDQLAKEGVMLNNYYVNPVCSPTRASLMSGRSVFHHGIQTPYGMEDNAEGLNLTYTILPQHLKQAYNYSTYMIGKWHLGFKAKEYLPSSRGFDRYMGYYAGVMDYWKHYTPSPEGYTALDFHLGGVLEGLLPGEEQPLYNTSGQYSTSLFADTAAKWIAEHAKGVDTRDHPLFMYMPMQGAHSGDNLFVQAPESYIEKFEEISPDRTCGQWENTDEGECTKPAMRKTIAAVVSALDDAIATVVQALKDADMYDDTLLVISTDNGGPTDGADNNMMNNFPLRGCKGGYFEGGVRGVGLVHGANVLQKTGYVSEALHHVSDWLPTLLTAAANGLSNDHPHPHQAAVVHALKLGSGEIPMKLGDGIDNWNAISSGSASARTELAHITQAEGSLLSSHAMRIGDMKLIWNPSTSDCSRTHAGWYTPPNHAWNYSTFTVKCGKPPSTPAQELLAQCTSDNPCLFNISSDPCEYTDLSDRMPEIVAQLRTRLNDYQQTAVLPWVNFEKIDPRANPTNFGPTGAMAPDPIADGPHQYQGLWAPWLTTAEESMYYPTHYTGPGYP